MQTTGTTLSGSSANFMTGVYQFLATNQVSAQFLMSNADFFNTFFGWLGAEVTQFSDLSSLGDAQSFELMDGLGTINLVVTDGVTLPDSSVPYKYHSSLTWYMPDYDLWTFTGNLSSGGGVGLHADDKGIWLKQFGKFSECYDSGGDHLYSYMDDTGNPSVYITDVSTLYVTPNTTIFVYGGGCFGKFNNTYELWDGERWNTDFGTVVSTGEAGAFDGQIIGADAQYDDAGNITDYGNVTVPNVFAPDYTAPGSYAEALNQMNATATTDQHATAESPAFGQAEGTTVKDWTDANKPTDTPKPSEGSQDDFKIADLETVFPFCIPWDLYYLLSALTADPVAPQFVWTFDFAGAGRHDFAVDLSPWEPVAQVVRIGETLLFCVGLALVSRDLIRG